MQDCARCVRASSAPGCRIGWAPRSSRRPLPSPSGSPRRPSARRSRRARSRSRRMRPTCWIPATVASTSRSTSRSRTSSRTRPRRSSTTPSYLTAIHPDAVGLTVTDAAGALSFSTKERRFFARLEVDPPKPPVLQPVDTVHRPLRPGGWRAPLEFVGPREPGVRDVRRVGVGRPRPEHGRGPDAGRLRDHGRRRRHAHRGRRRTGDPHGEAGAAGHLLRDPQRREPRGVQLHPHLAPG